MDQAPLNEEVNVADVFGASFSSNQQFAFYLPNKDFSGQKIELELFETWKKNIIAALSKVGGGVTIIDGMRGVWVDPENGNEVSEETILIYCYIDGEKFLQQLTALADLVRQFGLATNQGEVAFEFAGTFYKVPIRRQEASSNVEG